MTALEKRLECAIALATEAGRMAMRLRPPPGAAVATLKGAQDWLTEADGAVEAFLSEQLEKEFPGDGFQGEETGSSRAGALRWVVDPIDGTANYARGSTRFCVSLGLLEGDEPVVGVIVAPALCEIFAARRGGGATLNDVPIRVAETPAIGNAIVELGWSHRRPVASFHAMCVRVMATGAVLRHGGSGALGLADVAAGRTDAYAELHINLWDVAAGMAILREAGAYISPFMQSGGGTEGAAILVATPGLAPALLAATEIAPAA
jgi:myo-inositol-1(or 4)-monophosphatase